MDYPTTTKDFEHFKKMFKKWAKRNNLLNYYYEYDHLFFKDHPDIEEDKHDALALVYVDMENKTTCAMLNKDSADTKPTKHIMELTAFHEVREVFYYPLRRLLAPYYSKEYISEQIHSLIQVDINMFFP